VEWQKPYRKQEVKGRLKGHREGRRLGESRLISASFVDDARGVCPASTQVRRSSRTPWMLTMEQRRIPEPACIIGSKSVDARMARERGRTGAFVRGDLQMPVMEAWNEIRMLSKSKKTGNVLSTTESQGFRKQMGFGPELN
jgi:hypothetical protein